MTAQIRLKALVLPLLGRRDPRRVRRLVLRRASPSSPAERHAAAEKIIEQATGPNPAARSAPDRRHHRAQRQGLQELRGADRDHRQRGLQPARRRGRPGARPGRRPRSQRRRVRRRYRRRRREGLHHARQHRLQAAGCDLEGPRRAGAGGEERADEDGRDVLHQPAGLADERARHRRGDGRRRAHREAHGRRPRQRRALGPRQALRLPDADPRDTGRRPAHRDHAEDAGGVPALREGRERRRVDGQGRPRPAQGPRDGEARRRQEAPQDAARSQERDARRDRERLRGRRPARDQRADAARPATRTCSSRWRRSPRRPASRPARTRR